MFGSLKKYPKISGYLDRISKIWIMKKIDIQSIQVSMYPKKTDIHVSIYPCIQVSMISKYPIIQVSKKNWYPRYPNIRISKKSGIRPSLPAWYQSYFISSKTFFREKKIKIHTNAQTRAPTPYYCSL